MVRCCDCGWIGEPEELKAEQESRGEFWGMPAYEAVDHCPECGSDYIVDAEEEEEEE